MDRSHVVPVRDHTRVVHVRCDGRPHWPGSFFGFKRRILISWGWASVKSTRLLEMIPG